MLPNDGGLLRDIEHFSRKVYYEDRKRGKQNDTALAFMAGSMVVIGAKMLIDIWARKQGRGR